jgi:ATP-dependent DNA ligase
MSAFVPARLGAVSDLPIGQGWLYEPKFDGYRGLLVTGASGRGSLWSRNEKDLGRWFPELVSMAGRLPRGTVLDGEIVMPTESGVSFIGLQRRLASLGRESPVAFIAFDALRCTEDLRSLRLSQRRQRLERLIEAAGDSSLQMMTQTSDRDAAVAWLDPQMSLAGIEGVVAKLDEPYPKPNTRRWRKARRVSTKEFAVRGFIPEGHEAMRLVLAMADPEARLVGTSYPITGRDLKPLADFVDQARPAERRIWAPFEDGRNDWYELPPAAELIAEVMVTTLDSGLLRQPARFLRWRVIDPSEQHRRSTKR